MSYLSNLFYIEQALNNLIQQSGLNADLLYYIFKSKTNQLKAICFEKDKDAVERELLKLQNLNNSPPTEDQIK